MLVILQGYWHSGDKFHLPLTLLMGDGRISIRILCFDGDEETRREADGIADYYRMWGFGDRVKLRAIPPPTTTGGAAARDEYAKAIFREMLTTSYVPASELASVYKEKGAAVKSSSRRPQSKAATRAPKKGDDEEKEKEERAEERVSIFPYQDLGPGKDKATLGRILGVVAHYIADPRKFFLDTTCVPRWNAASLKVMPQWHDRLLAHFERLVHDDLAARSNAWTVEACAARMVTDPEIWGRAGPEETLASAPALVFLWGRRSGKRRTPGPHPEHTSGGKALNQIAGAFQKQGWTIARVGDGTAEPRADVKAHFPTSSRWRESPKVDEHERLKRKEYEALRACVDLTEIHQKTSFSSESAWLDIYGGYETRSLLVQLFIYVQAWKERKHRTVHVGMRSGMLIALAYFGIPVVFMEEVGCPTAGKWEGLQDMRSLVRCQLHSLPSSAGRRLHALLAAGWKDKINAHAYAAEQRFIDFAVKRVLATAGADIDEAAEQLDSEVVAGVTPSWEDRANAALDAGFHDLVAELVALEAEGANVVKTPKKKLPAAATPVGRDALALYKALLVHKIVRKVAKVTSTYQTDNGRALDDDVELADELLAKDDVERLCGCVGFWLKKPDAPQKWAKKIGAGALEGRRAPLIEFLQHARDLDPSYGVATRKASDVGPSGRDQGS